MTFTINYGKHSAYLNSTHVGYKRGNTELHYKYSEPPKKKYKMQNKLLKTIARDVVESGQHNDLYKVYTELYVNPKKKPYGKGVSFSQYTEGWAITKSGEGKQITEIGFEIGNVDQWTKTPPDAGGNSRITWPVNPFDLAPNEFDTGNLLDTASNAKNPPISMWNSGSLTGTGLSVVDGKVIPPSGANVSKASRIHFRQAQGVYTFTNFTNTNLEFDYYWCAYKRPSKNSMDKLFQDANTTQWNGMTVASHPASSSDINTFSSPGTNGGMPLTAIMNNPFAFGTVRKYVRVLKKRKILLKPGATVEDHFKIHFNKVVTNEYLTEMLDQNMKFMDNHTVFLYVRLKGAPVLKIGINGGTDEAITTANVKLGQYFAYTCYFDTLCGNRTKYLRSNLQLISNTGVTTKIIDDTDQVKDEAMAGS